MTVASLSQLFLCQVMKIMSKFSQNHEKTMIFYRKAYE
ncbi:hypothetical protein LAC1533_1353 [Ligilactobacillus acidipiscis]|uniref:Uncharacterized protein n=1 Tax=Ligilactobacillus acidipiscis TaxID=89059 RepID=A0A1K1KPM3_9LACO|nr:hypothetical protein LAC1533_1353 [Ligilactobacillus acidipiscis]